MPEVSSQTRSLLSGSNPYQKLPICVEISLKTSEGDSMILETWLLSMTDSADHQVCPQLKSHNLVYKQKYWFTDESVTHGVQPNVAVAQVVVGRDQSDSCLQTVSAARRWFLSHLLPNLQRRTAASFARYSSITIYSHLISFSELARKICDYANLKHC
jgi:hypothetical protein